MEQTFAGLYDVHGSDFGNTHLSFNDGYADMRSHIDSTWDTFDYVLDQQKDLGSGYELDSGFGSFLPLSSISDSSYTQSEVYSPFSSSEARDEYVTSSVDYSESTPTHNPRKRQRNEEEEEDDTSELQPTSKKQKGSRPTRSLSTSTTAKTHGLTLKDLIPVFDLPIKDAAARLNLCTTLLKQLCRRIGIQRWPQRKIAALDKRISKLEDTLRKESDSMEKSKLKSDLDILTLERDRVINGFGTPSENSEDK